MASCWMPSIRAYVEGCQSLCYNAPYERACRIPFPPKPYAFLSSHPGEGNIHVGPVRSLPNSIADVQDGAGLRRPFDFDPGACI